LSFLNFASVTTLVEAFGPPLVPDCCDATAVPVRAMNIGHQAEYVGAQELPCFLAGHCVSLRLEVPGSPGDRRGLFRPFIRSGGGLAVKRGCQKRLS
jgi:hypothetical protein